MNRKRKRRVLLRVKACRVCGRRLVHWRSKLSGYCGLCQPKHKNQYGVKP